ncbi:PSP1 domain protein [Dehalogenimonas lykanthroporepellens BL-DC-9]|jgi:cell fate regulator YaaT (PSP1 superfamily)|nr:PSP1 domain protein [Dehalogenimonas lykanthroporepellens BL-DC-9]
MKKLGDVKFKKAGKHYTFDATEFEVDRGDMVIVETSRGQEIGQVVDVRTTEDAESDMSIKPVIRIATKEDIEQKRRVCHQQAAALIACREQVAKLKLPMKCLSAEYNLDETHITVYFSAEGRVDFRELVREMGKQLHVRVELRQIGPRDETKLLGGFGRCGREFCCASYLSEFEPVSIKMAKEQNLPLNPLKISGVCGRLLCCLGHEYETYKEMNREKACSKCMDAPDKPTSNIATIKRAVVPEKPVANELPIIVDTTDEQSDNTSDGIIQRRPPRRRRRKR